MSNFKLVINDEFKNLKNFLLNIRTFFQENKNTIHKARNEIKVINYENKDLVVKSFKIPNLINRIVYTFTEVQKQKNLMNML